MTRIAAGRAIGKPAARVCLRPAPSTCALRLPLSCALAILGALGAQAQTARETVLRNFGYPPKGANPGAGVVRDPAGNLYGTAFDGGIANRGVVYKVDASGRQTVLHTFTGGADGGDPYAGVIRDSAGNLYGTGIVGGPFNLGVIFKIDGAGQETVLYSFAGGASGASPYGGVILDPAGNLYGTTGGLLGTNCGVVYKLDTAGHQTVLHSFTGGSDGCQPAGGVIRDSASNLYGATADGGTAGAGAVYKVDAAGHETVLYSFTGGADGKRPGAGVIRDSEGNLYGTTAAGGTAGAGVVFKLDASGQETVLHDFKGPDGASPGGVILGSAGNLYGTTSGGGKYAGACALTGCGVVYKLDAAGQETVLHSFTDGIDGGNPYGGVILDPAGNLCGTTYLGGADNMGAVFRVDAYGQETTVYSFPGAANGNYPQAGVILDLSGSLYGTTYNGGNSTSNCLLHYGCGVIYKLDPAGHETVLYDFTGRSDGGYPCSGVTSDSAGNLYGTTEYGGIAPGYDGLGVVYKLDTAGQYTVLYAFDGDAGLASGPSSGVILDAAGNLYGTFYSGTGPGCGEVYKLDAAGHFAAVYTFKCGADGAFPNFGVILDSAGNLYGTTAVGGRSDQGVVYKVDTAGQEIVLYSFTGADDGGFPSSSVVRDSAGNLYGTTQSGGAEGAGVLFKVDTAGHETVLHNFGTDGAMPWGGLIRDAGGNLYGTTVTGGAGAGVVYKLEPSGQYAVLYSFTGGDDGGYPYSGVIRDAAGNLYGTATNGGNKMAGVVFEVEPE